MRNIIGFDIGGVILERPPFHVLRSIQKGNCNVDSIVNHALPINHVTEAIRGIANKFNPENIFLISKASDQLAGITIDILRKRKFFSFTGIPENNVHFVHTLQEKVTQCVKCGIGHFVDDRPEVLTLLGKVSPDMHLILFQAKHTNQRFKCDSHYSIVDNGRHLYTAITH